MQEPGKVFADATELVRSNVDFMVASGPELAVKAWVLAASSTVPIVVWANNYDLVARGYVQSLAHPGGSVTGVFTRQPELAAKQVEILKETFPDRTRITVLWDAFSTDQFALARSSAAKSLALTLHAIKLENPPYDIAAVFRRVAESQPQSCSCSPVRSFGPHNKEIVAETLRARLPAMFIFKSYAELGGLMSYGVGHSIELSPTRPMMSPIYSTAQNRLTFRWNSRPSSNSVLNLKTAKALGLGITNVVAFAPRRRGDRIGVY